MPRRHARAPLPAPIRRQTDRPRRRRRRRITNRDRRVPPTRRIRRHVEQAVRALRRRAGCGHHTSPLSRRAPHHRPQGTPRITGHTSRPQIVVRMLNVRMEPEPRPAVLPRHDVIHHIIATRTRRPLHLTPATIPRTNQPANPRPTRRIIRTTPHQIDPSKYVQWPGVWGPSLVSRCWGAPSPVAVAVRCVGVGCGCVSGWPWRCVCVGCVCVCVSWWVGGRGGGGWGVPCPLWFVQCVDCWSVSELRGSGGSVRSAAHSSTTLAPIMPRAWIGMQRPALMLLQVV